VVLGSQVGRESPDRRQVDRTLPEHLQDDGKPTRRPGHLDTVVGLPLRQAEGVPAISEERGVALAKVDVACVQLRQMRDDLGGDATLAANEGLDLLDELWVGEASETIEDIVLHITLYQSRMTECVHHNDIQTNILVIEALGRTRPPLGRLEIVPGRRAGQGRTAAARRNGGGCHAEGRCHGAVDRSGGARSGPGARARRYDCPVLRSGDHHAVARPEVTPGQQPSPCHGSGPVESST
jgi:hypothetical protein